MVFISLVLLSILGNLDDGYAFEAHTLTNQRTGNFHACTQGKCQGPGQDGGINSIRVEVGPFQNPLYYRIGDTPNDFGTNSQAGGMDPGADSMLGTGLVDHANVRLTGKTNCIPGVDNRCVDDTNDVQPCGATLPTGHGDNDTMCSSRTKISASTSLPKRLFQNDFDKGGPVILDQRITGSNFSVSGTGYGTPSTDLFSSWGYDAGGVECPTGHRPPCRINRIDFGMVSIYVGGNAGFTSANSNRQGYIINSITDGDGKIIGHIRMDQTGNELSSCTGWNANTGAYGTAAICNVISFKDPNGVSINRAVVIDGRATGWSRSDSNFNPGGGTPCPSNPAEQDLLTCGSWSGPNGLITTWKATGPIYTQANPIPYEGTGNSASNCIFRGTIFSTATGSICDNIKYDDGTMGEAASPNCAGTLAGPTDQHGASNGSGCAGF